MSKLGWFTSFVYVEDRNRNIHCPDLVTHFSRAVFRCMGAAMRGLCDRVNSGVVSSCFLAFSLFTILQLYCLDGISPMGTSGWLLRGKPAATESRYPTYSACWVFLCFLNPPNFDMDYRIFNVRTDVNACDCTGGCADTVRESALKWKYPA